MSVYIYLSILKSGPGGPHATRKHNQLNEAVQYKTVCSWSLTLAARMHAARVTVVVPCVFSHHVHLDLEI